MYLFHFKSSHRVHDPCWQFLVLHKRFWHACANVMADKDQVGLCWNGEYWNWWSQRANGLQFVLFLSPFLNRFESFYQLLDSLGHFAPFSESLDIQITRPFSLSTSWLLSLFFTFSTNGHVETTLVSEVHALKEAIRIYSIALITVPVSKLCVCVYLQIWCTKKKQQKVIL